MIAILLVILGVVAVIGFNLQGFVARLNALNRDTSRQFIYQTAMSSLLSYTEAGIKRRWCFTNTWMPAGSTDCNLAHPMSSERLLMSSAQEGFINAMIAANPSMPHATPLQLESFTTEVDTTSLPVDHPIKQIFGTKDFDFLGKIKFKISRIHNLDIPVFGSESHIQIEAELLAATGKSLPDGRTEMKAWSKTTFYPREVGLFGLIVPGDLWVNGNTTTLQKGDVAFPFRTGTSSKGIVFESPVLVNGDINIPLENAPSYVDVTFSEMVTIGGGLVKQNGHPAKPATATAADFSGRMSANFGFGGFQQGINIDGEFDAGLLKFAETTSIAADDTLMKKCIDRNKVKTDFARTADSSLLVKSTSPGVFELSWSRDNFFSEQTLPVELVPTGAFTTPPVVTGSEKPVMSFDVNFTRPANGAPGDAPSAKFNMPKNGTATLYPQLLDTSANYAALRDAETAGSPRYVELAELFDKAVASEANPPGVEIKISPVSHNGADQKNRFEMKVQLIHPENFVGDFKIDLTGFDVSFIRDKTTREAADISSSKFNSDLKDLEWKRPSSTALSGDPVMTNSISSTFKRADNVPATSTFLTVDLDWNALEIACNPATSDTNIAFQPSNWDYSFAPTTRYSWNINPLPTTPTVVTDLILDGSNSGPTNAQFLVRSIVPNCIIESSAELVTGFFVCDNLIIKGGRTTPLRIIATFITNSISVDPSVYQLGIRWSNIYNPNAVQELRTAGVLKPKWSTTCEPAPSVALPLSPVWHPSPLLSSVDDNFNCNSISLRAKADPFTWTAMDPDCGIKASSGSTLAPATTCKHRPVRFSDKEFDRGFSL